jgi:hypothetical protein
MLARMLLERAAKIHTQGTVSELEDSHRYAVRFDETELELLGLVFHLGQSCRTARR